MKHVRRKLLIIAALKLCATQAVAQSISGCADLTNVDAFPDGLKALAPISVDEQTGWFIREGKDNAGGYLVDSQSVFLLKKLSELFQENSQTELALVVPPPRTLFSYVDGDPRIPVERDAFSNLISTLKTAVNLTPNIFEFAQSEQIGDNYYFLRDTHWTFDGAMVSGRAVRALLDEQDVFSAGEYDTVYELDTPTIEKVSGYIAQGVRAVCDLDIPPEEIDVREAIKVSSDDLSSSLFGDGPDEEFSTALVGTSFSNKSNRDTFHWRDAMSYQLQADVENYAIEGGGFTSSMLALAQRFPQGNNLPDLLVWETPHNYWKAKKYSDLRNILGSFSKHCEPSPFTLAGETIVHNSGWIEGPIGVLLQDTINIFHDGSTVGNVDVEISYTDGTKEVARIRQTDRVPVEWRSTNWSMFIGSHKEGVYPNRIKYRIDGETYPLQSSISVCSQKDSLR